MSVFTKDFWCLYIKKGTIDDFVKRFLGIQTTYKSTTHYLPAYIIDIFLQINKGTKEHIHHKKNQKFFFLDSP